MTTFAVAFNNIKRKMNNNRPLIAHVCCFLACAFWGLMAPLGKDAMTHGITGLDMVSFRVAGGALLFWITSLFTAKEHVPTKDKLMLIGAAVFGLVTNQCCYTIGLSITSPINSSVVTTSMPIFAMILSAIILKEPITGKKALGVLFGCTGAVALVLTSANAASDKVGDIRGDLLCLAAQFSFALYLALFSKLVRKYSVITVNKWMFTWATIMILPFTLPGIMTIDIATVPQSTWWESAFVVFFGTYVSYILMMVGQSTLRPTVVGVYNYVQPAVSVIVSILTGMGIMNMQKGVAILLVCFGVWLVIKSKSKADMEKERINKG